jgi:hypothetical protein
MHDARFVARLPQQFIRQLERDASAGGKLRDFERATGVFEQNIKVGIHWLRVQIGQLANGGAGIVLAKTCGP